ncbi:T9SS type A sorting domain-containing protein [Polaribacter septentrionalilitoris]|uniref:T9SS type A sorting domain-containing protein n=1 Tax=Polaribacter septentrionalilitoris TaxID=2494657 RepID=UPI00135CC67E|nr:T9SS type A sorting domain-containing protein [Polaribacter septentrionalilitoris]
MKLKLLLFFFIPVMAFSQSQLGNQINNPDESNTKPSKFGTGVAVSDDGSIIAVGAPGNNENSFVRVFKYVNNDWQQLGNDITNESILEKVGHGVSLSSDGKILAVGAPEGGDLDEGHIRIYEYKNDAWEKIGQIVGDGTQFYLGYKVVLSPDAKFLAATAYKTNSSKKGFVNVYENINGTWTQRGTTLEGEFNYDAFGYTLDMSDDGNVLAIGNKGRKKVKVFKFENNDWAQIGDDFTGLNTTTREFLSVSLSSNGNKVAIGSSEGVSIYENNNDTWSLLGSKITNGSITSLSSDGTKIAVGSPYNYTVKNYIYNNDNWTQRGEDVSTWRSSNFSESLALSADGDTFISASNKAFPRVYTFNTTLLSVEKNSIENLVALYPNPVFNNFKIKVSNDEFRSLTIYNLLGKKILESRNTLINFSSFPKGIYMVKIRINTRTITKKIIKN